MSNRQYNIWSEKKLAEWFEETSASEREMLKRNAQGFDFTADIVEKATEDDWLTGQRIAKKWKQKNVSDKGGVLKWLGFGGVLALMVGLILFFTPNEQEEVFTPQISTQPSPIPNVPKEIEIPAIPKTQSTQSTQDVDQNEIQTTDQKDVGPIEHNAIDDKEIDPSEEEKVEKKKPAPKKEEPNSKPEKVVQDTSKNTSENVTEQIEVPKVKTREIREITVMEKVGDGDKNKRYAASDLVSYYGGKEVLKGELYDMLKDEMKIEDIPQSARSVVFEFWVSHSGNVQDVNVMSRISKNLEDKIVEVVESLSDWSEGNRRIDVGYTVYVTFY